MVNLPTLSIPTLSMLTKWELTKWEVDQMGIDKVGIDEVGIDEVGRYPFNDMEHFSSSAVEHCCIQYLIFFPIIVPCISSFISTVPAKQLKKACNQNVRLKLSMLRHCCIKIVFPETTANILTNHAGGRKKEKRTVRLQWNQTY